MRDQVHAMCEPIRPEDVPADLIDLYRRAFTSTVPTPVETATRTALAVVLTEVCERIAQAVEAECADEVAEGMFVVSPHGELAAAIVRSWPEDLDA